MLWTDKIIIAICILLLYTNCIKGDGNMDRLEIIKQYLFELAKKDSRIQEIEIEERYTRDNKPKKVLFIGMADGAFLLNENLVIKLGNGEDNLHLLDMQDELLKRNFLKRFDGLRNRKRIIIAGIIRVAKEKGMM